MCCACLCQCQSSLATSSLSRARNTLTYAHRQSNSSLSVWAHRKAHTGIYDRRSHAEKYDWYRVGICHIIFWQIDCGWMLSLLFSLCFFFGRLYIYFNWWILCFLCIFFGAGIVWQWWGRFWRRPDATSVSNVLKKNKREENEYEMSDY